MNALQRSRAQAWLILGLMLCSLWMAKAWRPTMLLSDSRPRLDLEVAFPKQFGQWTIDTRMPVSVVSPDQEAMISKIYSQTLSRTYVNQRGERIMLSVAYGGDQSDATRAHRPEVCYSVQGFQVKGIGEEGVALADGPLRTRRLMAQLGNRHEPITYWMVVGERVALSGTEQKLAQLSYSMRGVLPDGMLVRVSNISENPVTAFRAQDEFIRDLSTHVAPSYQSLIFGAHS